jgi:hypothetical protein
MAGEDLYIWSLGEAHATSAISQVFEAPVGYSGDLEVVRLTY